MWQFRNTQNTWIFAITLSTSSSQDVFLKVVFVKTEDNDVDIFIKNFNGELYAHHAKKMVMKKERVK